MPSHRVLKLSFEFHVPEGLAANIRFARIEAATARIVGAVEALASTVFPWADHVDVKKEWSYRWWSEPETIKLPTTDKNTVTDPQRADDTDTPPAQHGSAERGRGE